MSCCLLLPKERNGLLYDSGMACAAAVHGFLRQGTVVAFLWRILFMDMGHLKLRANWVMSPNIRDS